MASPQEHEYEFALGGEICDLLYHHSIMITDDLNIRHLDNNPELKARFIPLARAWLIAKGVDESQAYKASPYVLVNAFKRGDAYVNKMRGEIAPARKSPKGFSGIDLDERGIDFNQPIVKSPDYKPTLEPEKLPDSTKAPNGIDAEQIARAAEAVLTKALDYRRETRDSLAAAAKQIEQTLGSAVDRRWTEAERHFAERTKELVKETQDLVLDLAAKQIPREIIVRTEKTSRTLPTEIRHEAFDRILRWLLSGEHVYIVGPAGTGKTHMAKQLASAIGKELYLPGQALSKYDISGYKGPTGEYFGTVVRDALENGGLLFVDEGDMWAAAALGFLNAPLANGWAAFPDRTIQVHPDFQCMIAANTYGRGATQEYIGRNPLDAASVDRFAFVVVDYDENMERLLYGNSPWVQYIHRVRSAIRELKLRHVVSTRAIARVLRGLSAGLSIDDICFSSLWRGLDQDTILKIKTQAGEPPRVLKTLDLEDNFKILDDEVLDEIDLANGTER